MSADVDFFVRGPGLMLVLAAACAVSWLLYLARRRAGLLAMIGIGAIVPFDPALGVTLWLLAVLFAGAWHLLRAEWGRATVPPAYAWREADDGERAMSRAEVAAEFAAWNAMIERGVALLKALPRVPPGNARRIAAMGEDIRAAREAMLGEKRRLRRLRLVFDDPAEGERMERVLAAILPLAAEMWEAASDPAGYAQRARQRGTRGGAGGDAPV